MIAQEQAVLEGYELRRWHVADSRYQYAYNSRARKEHYLNQALTHIERYRNQDNCLTAIQWLMESYNTSLLETKLFLLRTTYEFLNSRIPAQLYNFMDRLKLHFDRSGVNLPTWWHPRLFLVIGRHSRNFATHAGILSPTATTSRGQTLEQAIRRECTEPHANWNDGCVDLIPLIDSVLANPNGFSDLTIGSALYLDLLLYLFCIDYIGLDFTQVDGFQEDFIHYVTTLSFV